MATIRVQHNGGTTYRVEVDAGSGRTVHDEVADRASGRRRGEDVASERIIGPSLALPLKREPRDSILRSFALPVIEPCFPGHCEAIRKRLR